MPVEGEEAGSEDEDALLLRHRSGVPSLRGSFPPPPRIGTGIRRILGTGSYCSRKQQRQRGGRWMEKRLPSPGALSTLTRPPCACATCLTMARPRPVPPLARLRALSTR